MIEYLIPVGHAGDLGGMHPLPPYIG